MNIQDYEPIVGRSAIQELRLLGDKLSGQTVRLFNSTATGGGVAEILARMVPMLNQLGVDAHWDVIKGNAPFFQVTKKFHNALHGQPESFSQDEFALFLEVARENARALNLSGDILFIHDPQPIALVERRDEVGGKWVWRCHIDVSNPHPGVWSFLQPFIARYDAAIFSAPIFSHPLPIPQFLISPSIDPLNDKNRELSQDTIDSILGRLNLPQDKPIILQVSRFDRLKDPVGVIQAFKMVRSSLDCRLVLAGGTASDDPESDAVLAEVRDRASADPDIHVLVLPPDSNVELNALQRAAAVVLQKSLKEGFGLTVSEALWKAKPVVASATGGIPLQVIHKYTGLLSHGIEGTAYAIKQLLSNPDYAQRLGKNGREHVRQNFLITRHLKEYLLLFLTLGRREDVVYL